MEEINTTTVMDWVTFGIAIAGFLMSLGSWVHTFITQRKRLSFKIQFFRYKENSAYMYLMIENRSRLPVSITGIALKQSKSIVPCVQIPKTVSSTTRKTAGNTDVVYQYSTAIPIQLSALESVSCIVLFEGIPEVVPPSATHLTFQISTNRGRKVKRKLALPQDWHDQKGTP